jgi:hypothetical protein
MTRLVSLCCSQLKPRLMPVQQVSQAFFQLCCHLCCHPTISKHSYVLPFSDNCSSANSHASACSSQLGPFAR